MKRDEQCQIGGCNESAKYALYRTLRNGQKVWLYVCIEHERQIGNENLRRWETKDD